MTIFIVQNKLKVNQKMKDIKITKEGSDLHNEFSREYCFVVVSVEVVQEYLNKYKNHDLGMLLDYIVSNDLAEEICE